MVCTRTIGSKSYLLGPPLATTSRPVRSMTLLLCPNADGPTMTGLLQQKLPDGLIYDKFRYNVVRTWK